MNTIYNQLEEKNNWYTKYLLCTEAFLAGIRHAPEIALDELELFYGNRESLLKIMDGIDKKIGKAVEEHNRMGVEFSTEQMTRVQYYLREKDAIVAKIVKLDEELMGEIDKLRAKSDEKIKLLAKGKKALANYKSTTKHNEKIDKRV